MEIWFRLEPGWVGSVGCGGGSQEPGRGAFALRSTPYPRDLVRLERGRDVPVGLGAARVFPVNAGRRDAGNNL